MVNQRRQKVIVDPRLLVGQRSLAMALPQDVRSYRRWPASGKHSWNGNRIILSPYPSSRATLTPLKRMAQSNSAKTVGERMNTSIRLLSLFEFELATCVSLIGPGRSGFP